MADSDNTTTLPFVTRRKLPARMQNPMAGQGITAFRRNDLEAEQSTDPAVTAWRKWQVAHKETNRLSRRQQQLERKLVEEVGFPCVAVELRNGERITVHSAEALRKTAEANPAFGAGGVAGLADLVAHQARWDSVDTEIGYSAALRAESEAGERAMQLLKELFDTPASSWAGVAAKLGAVLEEAQPSDDDPEFPWPLVRSALQDVIRLGGQEGPSLDGKRPSSHAEKNAPE